MSKLSEDYLKILKDIEKHISNEEEKKYVNRKGRNPVTGEMFTIEPYFRPMLKFPDAVYHEFRERERKGDSE